ncbi:hypothetical protein pb186bvf_000238 [Paramecium bursaria]
MPTKCPQNSYHHQKMSMTLNTQVQILEYFLFFKRLQTLLKQSLHCK